MTNKILSIIFAAALSLSACSTTGTVTKVNGVTISEETKSSPDKALIAVGLIGLAAVVGLTLIGDNDEGQVDNSTADQYTQCIEAGFPEPYCRSLVT